MIKVRKELMTKSQYSELYCINRVTLNSWINKGIVAVEQIGGKIFVNSFSKVCFDNKKGYEPRIKYRYDLQSKSSLISLSPSQIDIRIKTGVFDVEIINNVEYIVIEKNKIIKHSSK
jgi:hypothetical protein